VLVSFSVAMGLGDGDAAMRVVVYVMNGTDIGGIGVGVV